jgi:hypothetical protein
MLIDFHEDIRTELEKQAMEQDGVAAPSGRNRDFV